MQQRTLLTILLVFFVIAWLVAGSLAYQKYRLTAPVYPDVSDVLNQDMFKTEEIRKKAMQTFPGLTGSEALKRYAQITHYLVNIEKNDLSDMDAAVDMMEDYADLLSILNTTDPAGVTNFIEGYPFGSEGQRYRTILVGLAKHASGDSDALARTKNAMARLGALSSAVGGKFMQGY